jgi:hypothetical protein
LSGNLNSDLSLSDVELVELKHGGMVTLIMRIQLKSLGLLMLLRLLLSIGEWLSGVR